MNDKETSSRLDIIKQMTNLMNRIDYNPDNNFEIAEVLYDEGNYRNKKDLAREIIERIGNNCYFQKKNENFKSDEIKIGYLLAMNDVLKLLSRLKNEYSQ